MNSRDELSVYGYIRQNFEQKCHIQEIIGTIIQFFKKRGGFLFVCGNGYHGRLGIKEFYNKECMKPTRVQTVQDIVDIAALNNHSMMVDGEGSVCAFGKGKHGRLGNGETQKQDVKIPQKIELKHRAISVCVGQRHSLILADSGAVLSCGRNGHRQLGHGDTENQSVPKVIEALKEHRITQISVGHSHNGALSEKGILFMWGWNYFGQCGVGEEKGGPIYTPQMINLNEKVSMIDCGNYHSLLITINNLLYSFGNGYCYKLGHGTDESKYVPTLIEALKDVNIINVAGGYSHTLCVDDELNVWVFGSNDFGQCAQPTDIIEEQTEPKKIEYFTTNKIKANQVAAGDCSSCVITQNKECFVFGSNKSYQIGLKEKKGYFIPTKLPLSVQNVSMGTNYSTFIGEFKEK